MREDRGPDGRFIKGHKPPARAGRPLGALNKLSKTIKEQALAGFEPPSPDDTGVSLFVRGLKKTHPAAAVPLLTKMIPSGDAPDIKGGAHVIAVNIISVKRGDCWQPKTGLIVGQTEARQQWELDNSARNLIAPFKLDDPDAT